MKLDWIYGTICIIFTTTFFIFILFELVIRWLHTIKVLKLPITTQIKHTFIDPDYVPPDNYKSAWLSDYMDEAIQCFDHIAHKAYTYWISKPFKGDHINIEKNGLRRTVNLIRQPAQHRILVLGGSTVWGWGVRDAATIPSYMSQYFAQHNFPIEVVNLGQLGYVNMQNLITLLMHHLLDKPSLVIFYEGLNDVLTSYQNRSADVAQNEMYRVLNFENMRRPSFLHYFSHTYIKKFYDYLLKDKTATPEICQNRFFFYMLAKEMKNRLALNYKVIKSLSESFNFGYDFYWHPTLFSKTTKTTYEKKLFKSVSHYDEFYHQVTHELASDFFKYQYVHNIASVLNIDDNAYIDPWHVDEKSNLRIAEHIAKKSILQIYKMNIPVERKIDVR